MVSRIKIIYTLTILLIILNLAVFYYAYYSPVFEFKQYGNLPFKSFGDNEDDISKNFYNVNKKEKVIPILILTCKRSTFLARTLKSLFQFHPRRNNPKSDAFPVLVSSACNDEPSKEVIQRYQDNISAVLYYRPNIELIKEIIQSNVKYREFIDFEQLLKYSRIADHYHTALNWTFGLPIDEEETKMEFKSKSYNFQNHRGVIILEDDLEISIDFYEYFNATFPLLEQDPTLYCISAWNDNGKSTLVDKDSPERLYRTDMFPGLGWILKKSLWLELEPHWPDTFWDEYMRKASVRKGRQCIRPELSRTYTFGDIGVSQSQFYNEHLQKQFLNVVFVNFSLLNLNYLVSPSYSKLWMDPLINQCEEMSATMVFGKAFLPLLIRIMYKSETHYLDLATMFDLLPDVKEGIPRSSYKGIVTFMFRHSRVFLYPRTLRLNFTKNIQGNV